MNILTSLNWVDYTIIAVIAISTLISIVRGFVREFLSLLLWIVAFWLSFKFAADVAIRFKAYIAQAEVRYLLAFVLIFIITLIVGMFIN
ncbi:MAG: CvpA family protein, partial [Pseudomonadota bacterium]